ncbi:gamma carbonic anhydrase family protein [Kerstersia gyiorum]|uniref:gamma carbonic anhydrase family protein n=1 Tax=Kerstersia gyiorum TaxID=206506 RepID=UPI00209CE915|nr:gamma carbonic anhydrase family protein [Kerstersia gyiorum]MCP1632908.1 carbonic anhydrase/acetyltransferase-like protein (isoleucine patch superfamily) [Kerstersia gyiorum]MCP1635560.1 carbonic anhydrase/acetyltransferase-like protein (isoleucine patch superfamily) [Kerstersia gyiorum]MCP1671034.1 carbonic anhydrase/acetyltransferase-like protein (isoleucine patch superfamily) [Kerstersia gyiorum]MCP1678311.1 carbonic anhydrase/acetyltransferase-like protein (isoleucine patch superfamily) 
MSIYKIGDLTPDIHPSAYIAAEATIIGQARLREGSSVWPQAVLRADNDVIDVGVGSNIQEGAVLHTDPGYVLKIGNHVTIGHQAMLHGCTIGDGSLIGIQAVILNGAVIGQNCLVGAGAVVTEGKEFPDNSLILGAPAKAARELTPEAIEHLKASARHYMERAQQYKTGLIRIG